MNLLIDSLIVSPKLSMRGYRAMKDITKKYTNGELTIVWQPALCIHSRICWSNIHGLPSVFKPMEKPWITMEGSTTERISEQIKKCPSGALSYFLNKDVTKE